jgi:hypothetical protein
MPNGKGSVNDDYKKKVKEKNKRDAEIAKGNTVALQETHREDRKLIQIMKK